jgi:hypothetical protein
VRFQSDIVRIVEEALSSARCRFLGRYKWYQSHRFCRYPWVQSAYRITLPTDVIVFSVKTILLKMRWIDLSSSVFFSLPSMILCSYLCEFCVLSLAFFFEFRFLRGWTISCLYPNNSVLRKVIVIVSNHPLLVVSRRNLLLVVSRGSTRCKKIR